MYRVAMYLVSVKGRLFKYVLRCSAHNSSLPVGEILAPSALISAENFVGYFSYYPIYISQWCIPAVHEYSSTQGYLWELQTGTWIL